MSDGVWENTDTLSLFGNKVFDGPISYLCIDDLAPLGYSFACIRNDTLFHVFVENNPVYRYVHVRGTVTTNPLYPSLAYRFRDSYYIDLIWMESVGDSYNIYYDKMYKFSGMERGDKLENTMDVVVYPNPFKSRVTFGLLSHYSDNLKNICIYNLSGHVVFRGSINANHFLWDTKDDFGKPLSSGIYLLKVKSKLMESNKLLFLNK
jgi:hypothetical protein